MEQLILIVNVLAALGIVGLVMIQQGKGADMGASFGAGASQTLFGSGGGGNVLTKTTALLVTVFFLSSFGLAVIAKNKASIDGGVDISVPAVVEDKSGVVVPVGENEIPGVEGEGIKSEIDAVDIPEVDAAIGSESDVPES